MERESENVLRFWESPAKSGRVSMRFISARIERAAGRVIVKDSTAYIRGQTVRSDVSKAASTFEDRLLLLLLARLRFDLNSEYDSLLVNNFGCGVAGVYRPVICISC
jgi:hypothetical protein